MSFAHVFLKVLLQENPRVFRVMLLLVFPGVLNISGVQVKSDNPFSTCDRAFGDCLKVGAAMGTDKDFETNLQKLIPDGLSTLHETSLMAVKHL